MKKTVLSLLALCCSCTMWAEDSMLTFRLNDGVNSEVSYKIGTDINRIVFKGNTVVLPPLPPCMPSTASGWARCKR